MNPSTWPTAVALPSAWFQIGFRGRNTPLTLLFLIWLAISAVCMTDREAHQLRDDTVDLFYHGYDSYMQHAFPEDELKPLSCIPLTRDRENEGHFELNDVLGNYTLTLVDSLSTLAIFASSQSELRNKRKPLRDFQNSVSAIVKLYGDGTSGASGLGSRARGFDLDSKVQVFETVIRGVGGLLSAHLFAVGELPIRGYHPLTTNGKIKWSNGFSYDGQLLRLAKDLATRLLPAFSTETGLPYPRVNLRYGVPFYKNSSLNQDPIYGQCELEADGRHEITETCSAGAGSLVMEFSVLSRLTGDMRFEKLANRAFGAVWSRRSITGLIGAGIDAESGEWVSPFTGIGAGIDSFFEYAMKAHVLLSRVDNGHRTNTTSLSDYYLSVWQVAHANNKHHLMRGPAFQHPHYVQGDLYTGAVRAFWIDSLSAYYPGLLALSGNVDEAIDVHLLFAALWARYSSLPERWNVAGGSIDSGLRWWGGRPEFVESTWYLYHATRDAWYLRVGEMILDDIKKRCWTECGWAGLEDVRTGELKDRMESFFLGETAKYLFLLFDRHHPLNTVEAPWVMNTEGHPLILPKALRAIPATTVSPDYIPATAEQCQVAPTSSALLESLVASRPNFFHAASLARLHFTPAFGRDVNTSVESSHWDRKYNAASRSSRNHDAFYPWTLPRANLPINGSSARMETRATFDLSFPTLPNTINGVLTAKRIPDGLFVNSVSGLKLGMIREPLSMEERDGQIRTTDVFRVHSVSHLTLGRDERVLLSTEVISNLNPVDPYFTRHRDITAVDIVVDLAEEPAIQAEQLLANFQVGDGIMAVPNATTFTNILSQLNSAFKSRLSVEDIVASAKALNAEAVTRPVLQASVATGAGAAPVPDVPDAPVGGNSTLIWSKVYVTGESCEGRLPTSVPKTNQVIVMKRGSCSFAQKLKTIPSFAPSESSLQLVVIVSDPDVDDGGGGGGGLIRPLLDETQVMGSGIVRPNPIPMVMIEGGDDVLDILARAKGLGVRRKYYFSSQGLKIGNLFVV